MQQIKQGLIQNAKIRKEYAKVKQRHQAEQEESPRPEDSSFRQEQPENDIVEPLQQVEDDQDITREDTSNGVPVAEAESVPVKRAGPLPEQDEAYNLQSMHESRRRRIKSTPYTRESRFAEDRRKEVEERRQAKAEAIRQREEKIQERERFRRAMAKARTGGKNGQRKLGRESNVLLERVKKLVGQ